MGFWLTKILKLPAALLNQSVTACEFYAINLVQGGRSMTWNRSFANGSSRLVTADMYRSIDLMVKRLWCWLSVISVRLDIEYQQLTRFSLLPSLQQSPPVSSPARPSHRAPNPAVCAA